MPRGCMPMNANECSQSLTSRQQRAVLALLAEPGVEKAAASVGVSQPTLWRWQQEPTFRQALAAARREAFAAATTAIAGACAEAVATLRDVATNWAAPAAARVSAARAILERAEAAIELQDLAIRLDAVEERLGEPGAKDRR